MSAGPPDHMRWIPTYPNAEIKADYYRRNADLLSAQREAIYEALSNASREFNFESSSLSGPYYDEFITRSDYWTEDFNKIRNSFESFLVELDLLISAAEGFESLWRSRILLGRWVKV